MEQNKEIIINEIQIPSGRQNGTTTLLNSVAIGACQQGLKVLYLLPTQTFVAFYKLHQCTGGAELHVFDSNHLKEVMGRYDYILIDGVDRCNHTNGNPIDLIRDINKYSSGLLTIVWCN